MDTNNSQSLNTEHKIVKLVNTALRQTERAGLSEMLGAIAQAVEAERCILWQVTPVSRLEDEPPSGQIFVLAEWCTNGNYYTAHNLPICSAIGEAIHKKSPINIENVDNDPRVKFKEFLKKKGICCFSAVPITFLDGVQGALSVYRSINRPFTQTEIEELEKLAELLPNLYQIIVDKVSYYLLSRVNRFIQKTQESDKNKFENEFKPNAEKLCETIAKTFQAFEVSLFLNNYLCDPPGVYKLMATTWPDRDSFTTSEYRASISGEGLTGWVLDHRKPISIFDLQYYEVEHEQLNIDYPGLSWKNPLQLEQAIRKHFGLSEGKELWPFSYMAAPILVGNQLLGVIRCNISIKAPYYFSSQDTRLFNIVADQIGQAWSNWLSRQKIEGENNIWKSFVKNITTINRLMQEQLASNVTDATLVFKRVLKALNDIIKNAEILDVALYSSKKKGLCFAAVYGDAWEQGMSGEVNHRKNLSLPTDELPLSGDAYVWKLNEVLFVENTRDPSCRYFDRIFPNTRRMIIAPISVADYRFGVLHIRGVGEYPFPEHAQAIAEFFGQKLGLYLHSTKIIQERDRLSQQQAQIFKNFAHELRSPINQLYVRATACIGEDTTSKTLMVDDQKLSSDDSKVLPIKDLMILRGLSSKVKKVSQSLSLFADLAQEKPILPKLSRLNEDYLIKMLIEAAIDFYSITDPSRKLRYHVERDSFRVLSELIVDADKDLLYKAVTNLLDNATKYSFPQTTIRIYGGLMKNMKRTQFYIAVINHGIKITEEESKMYCKTRGWRSDEAKEVTGEGSGIGLWIADNIMKAHGGDLVIVPTTPERCTEVKLVLPVEHQSI
ncbi:MAG: GAF domain-containing protein [Candidatus Competibacteraceae bacterium]